MRYVAVIAVVFVLSLVAPSGAGDPAIMIVPGTCLGIVPRGAPSGGDAIYCNQGTFIGLRDLQGGGPGGEPFGIGAGSTQDPSDLALNYDIGRCVRIFDGMKHMLARFCPHAITFYVKPRVRLLR